jgi:hypothetical protein
VSTEWTYLLADLVTNQIWCEAPMKVEQISMALNVSGNLNANMPVRQVPGDPYRYTTPGRNCVYVLRDGQPWWGGIIWSRSYQSASNVVTLGCSDWWTYYGRRFITGPSNPNDAAKPPPFVGDPPGQVGTADTGTTASGRLDFGYLPVAPGQYPTTGQVGIVKALLAHCAKYTGGNLRVEVIGPAIDTYKRVISYPNDKMITYGDALTKLTGIDANGPDLMFGVNGWDSTGAPRRVLYVGDPFLTHGAEGIVWEYGANMLTYQWPTSASDGVFATRVWQVRTGGTGANTMMGRADNTTRIADGWPLVEAKLDDISIEAAPTFSVVQDAATAGLVQKRLPVVIPVLTVRTDRPPYLNYMPGDSAKVCIQDEYFRTPMSVDVRITKVDASLTADTATISVNPIEDVV